MDTRRHPYATMTSPDARRPLDLQPSPTSWTHPAAAPPSPTHRHSRAGGGKATTTTALQPPASSEAEADARPRSPPPSSSSSKSALTIALQRAQSAVLLDSAQNYPAAITAYAQAVRLLRQVMSRVEEGSRDMERKRSSAGESGPREGESEAEWEKRKERYERKEKAKADEARRLKVIVRFAFWGDSHPLPSRNLIHQVFLQHDTYQDRIRMLVQMGAIPLPAAPSPSSSTRPTTPSASSTAAASPNHHQRRPSSPSPLPLPLTDPTHRPHPYSAAAAAAAATIASSSTTAPRRRGEEELVAVDDGDGDGHGIGAAMLELANTGPTYDRDREGGLGGDDDDFQVQQRSPAAGGRRRATEPVLRLERLPVVVAAGVEDSSSSSPAFSTAAVESTFPRYGNDHSLSSSRPPRRRPSFASDSTATARDDVEPIPPRHHDASRTPSSPLAAVAPPMRRGASAGALLLTSVSVPSSGSRSGSGSGSGSRSRAGSAASLVVGGGSTPPRASDMQRGYSTGSMVDTPVLLSRRGSSSIGIGGLAYIEEGPVRTPPVEGARPRPTRGASLGGGGGGGGGSLASGLALPTLATTTGGMGMGLVNSSTGEGTISQRRQGRTTISPRPGEGEDEFLAGAEGGYDNRSHTVVAAMDDFGRPTDSARHETWTTGSLPTRLRTESRLMLPLEWQTTTTVAEAEAEAEESSLPPLPKQQQPPPPPPLEISPRTNRRVPSSSSSTSYGHHRPSTSTSSFGTSAGGGGPSRKGSVPTPTSLTAPSLGRSTSASSSIASNASSSFTPRPLRRRRSSAAVGRGTPLSAASAAATGIYLSAGLANPPPDASSPASRETALSIPPPRRPFHLMRLVLATMSSSPTSTGGYISEKLFLPSAIWRTSPGGGGAATKLVALETKVRMLDLLSNGLDGLDKAGRGLLLVPIESQNARAVARQEADRFARELDSFEGLAEGVQSTLAKKLGPGVAVPSAPNGGGGGRKGSAVRCRPFSSLSMSTPSDASVAHRPALPRGVPSCRTA